MRRDERTANDYGRSKILSDRVVVDRFLEAHPGMSACMVLPGCMFGPGDIGSTSSGQLVLDFLGRKLPGIAPATFSVVDARSVAEAMCIAAISGRRGERYLAAGRHMAMPEILQLLEGVPGVEGPTRRVPFPLLYLATAMYEILGARESPPGFAQS